VQTLFRDVKLSLSQDTDTSADTTTDTDTLYRSRSVAFAVLRVSTLRMCKKGYTEKNGYHIQIEPTKKRILKQNGVSHSIKTFELLAR